MVVDPLVRPPRMLWQKLRLMVVVLLPMAQTLLSLRKLRQWLARRWISGVALPGELCVRTLPPVAPLGSVSEPASRFDGLVVDSPRGVPILIGRQSFADPLLRRVARGGRTLQRTGHTAHVRALGLAVPVSQDVEMRGAA